MLSVVAALLRDAGKRSVMRVGAKMGSGPNTTSVAGVLLEAVVLVRTVACVSAVSHD